MILAIDNLLSRLNRHRGLLYLFLLALILRVGYLLAMLNQLTLAQMMNLTPDTIEYISTAKGFLGLEFLDQQWLFLFGPGYGAFLTSCFFFFGVGPIAVFIVQILLSCVTCLMLYDFGKELTDSRAVGYGAGIIAAVSFTAVSQANIILSDTLFFFLFLAGNMLFIKGLKNAKWSYFVWSGITLSAAILTRTVGQFWPFIMILFIVVIPINSPPLGLFPRRLDLLKRALIAPLIALVIIGGWTVRNYLVLQMPVTAGAGPYGIGRLTAYTQMKLEKKQTLDEIYAVWNDQYKKEHQCDSVPWRESYNLIRQNFRHMMVEHPAAMLWSYLGRIKVNVTAANELYFCQLPQSKKIISLWLDRLHQILLHYVITVMTIWGFWLMIKRRLWMPVLFLGSLYLIFFFMVGFGLWQGSRLFFPAQIAWAVVVSYLVIDRWPYFRKIFHARS